MFTAYSHRRRRHRAWSRLAIETCAMLRVPKSVCYKVNHRKKLTQNVKGAFY